MSGNASNFIKLFPKDKIPIIFEAIFSVSHQLYRKTDHEREPIISKRLHSLLIAVNPFRDGPLAIVLEPGMPNTDDEDLPDGNIDFLVPSSSGTQAFFGIEAKKLRYWSKGNKFSTGNSYYISGGMMRFVDGKYSPHTQAGAMLGYVYDEKAQLAREGIRKLIVNKAKDLKLARSSGLKLSKSLRLKGVYDTRHDLDGRNFILYHIFLAVPIR